MQRAFALFVLALSFSVSVFAQDGVEELTPEKRTDIKNLMVMTGSIKLGEQLADAMMKSLMQTIRAAQPQVPDALLTIMKNEMTALFQEKAEAPGGLVDQMIPIYSKYWTQAEIKAISAFYRSELGQKSIATAPKIMSESMAVGEAWGRSLGPEIAKRIQEALKKEGIELPNN